MKNINKYTVTLVHEGTHEYFGTALNNSEKVANIAREILNNQPKEQFWIFLLDTKNKIIGMTMISQGTLNSSLVHPREVYQPAILANASAIIAVHNHPSGDTTPSREDLGVTSRLIKAGDILGIKLLDHVIIGDGYVSLRERHGETGWHSLVKESKE